MSDRTGSAPQSGFGRDLTTGSIPRHLVAFSLPMLAGSALQIAYAFINSIWVGQYLGTSAAAAVTVSFPVVFVLIALGAGMTLATNILISQHYGARDHAGLRRVVQSSTLLVGALALALTVLGEIFTPNILAAMGTPDSVGPLAVHYLRIFLLSLPLAFATFLARAMLQGVGDSRTPLYFQAASVVANALLDPVLMFGWLGMPALGLNGTAWASVIAQVGGVAALFWHLHRTGNPVSPDWRRLRLDWPTTLGTIRIGLPSAAQQSLISIGMVFVTGLVNHFGETATAAFGFASRVDQIAFLPALTFSMAIATATGQNIGAGRLDRVRGIFFWGCALSGGATLLCSALAVTMPRMLLMMFTSEPAVLDLGVHYLRIVGASYVFFAIMFVGNGVINGSGHTLVTTAISLVSLWVVRVPVAWWLSQRVMGSVEGVWYAMALSFGVSMCCCLAYYASGRWKRAVIRRLPAAPTTADSMLGDETGEA
jgi:putative MATE family efflux protein